jgi:hypothetical protein
MTSGTNPRPNRCVESGRRSTPGRARRALANMIAALTVNAAIILAIPRSTDTNPAPIVLQLNRTLINGCWEEGEFVDGETAMVAMVALDDSYVANGSSGWITPN